MVLICIRLHLCGCDSRGGHKASITLDACPLGYHLMVRMGLNTRSGKIPKTTPRESVHLPRPLIFQLLWESKDEIWRVGGGGGALRCVLILMNLSRYIQGQMRSTRSNLPDEDLALVIA